MEFSGFLTSKKPLGGSLIKTNPINPAPTPMLPIIKNDVLQPTPYIINPVSEERAPPTYIPREYMDVAYVLTLGWK